MLGKTQVMDFFFGGGVGWSGGRLLNLQPNFQKGGGGEGGLYKT